MESLLGLLRIHIKRGVNLDDRDVRTSVVVKMGNQRLKTRVIKKDVNPEWKEDLTLSVSDPSLPVKLIVYYHGTFSKNDKMGDAELDIRPFIDALKMNLHCFPSGTVLTGILPGRENCLSVLERGVWRGRDPAPLDRSPRLQMPIGIPGQPPFNT